MTLTELRYIVAVARERHFGRAAAACFVSQPTLSVAVRKLEDELGVVLFERHQHDVAITPVGERIVEQAQRVLEQAGAIKVLAGEGRNQLHGEARLGVIYTVGPYLLPRLIPELNQRAPALTPIIDEDFTANLAVKLRQGSLDMAILSTPFDVPGIEVRVLYTEPFVVALPRGHKLAGQRQIQADDLARETLLLLRAGNCFRDQVLEACPACRGETFSRTGIQKSLEGSSIETIRQMVAGGAGVTVLPAMSIRTESGMDKLLVYRPFADPSPRREVALAYRATFPRPKLVDLISDTVAACNLPGTLIATSNKPQATSKTT
ncbi:MAG: hydrogen peroxide-inducible genes activator [Gammaproteobacteria bacterium]|nr:hydrogen peroxide-inducible genes activator [Gammaproteobacteria bacterium]